MRQGGRDTIETGISPVYWLDRESAAPEPAQLRSISSGEPISWFDELLGGGIVLPPKGETNRAVTILLSGPPGTGKSTLATEFAYRLALKTPKRNTLYLSTEAPAAWLTDNAINRGWDKASECFVDITGAEAAPCEDDDRGCVYVLGLSESHDPNDLAADASSRIAKLVSSKEKGVPPASPQIKNFLDDLIRLVRSQPTGKTERGPYGGGSYASSLEEFSIVVLDSLNTSAGPPPPELFGSYARAISCGAQILFVTLDSMPKGQPAGFWEYAADIIIRLDTSYDESGYMTRTIEIAKARYQKHIWGRHQVKPYEKPSPIASLTPEERQRAFPVRKEGGLYIFPSLHYVSSVYKRRPPSAQPTVIPSCLGPDVETLFKGYPKGRCTALLGSRGTYKSHLAYIELLDQICNSETDFALIVSLRDDEGVTRRTLEQILHSDFRFAGQGSVQTGRERLLNLEQGRKLEVLYYPPGFIQPDEFFHRLFLAVNRIRNRRRDGNLWLLFNSIDQLPSRFPLCARESIFIPALVQMLAAEEVTSFFVAAKGPGQAQGFYGLESTAELILEVEREYYSQTSYAQCLRAAAVRDKSIARDAVDSIVKGRRIATLGVVRFPGVEGVGRRGFLELVSEEDPELFHIFKKRTGLHFVANAPEPDGDVSS